jgi:hypothetical protein
MRVDLYNYPEFMQELSERCSAASPPYNDYLDRSDVFSKVVNYHFGYSTKPLNDWPVGYVQLNEDDYVRFMLRWS